MEGNIASVHLEECVSGFCLQRGVECGFKWKEEREKRGGLKNQEEERRESFLELEERERKKKKRG